MRGQRLLFCALTTLILITTVVNLAPPPTQAEALLQTAPRLDGFTIYFADTSGEASRFDRGPYGVSRFAGLLQRLGAQLATLDWRRDFPADADLVVIVGPVTDLAPDQVARLWSYLAEDGRLLLLADPLKIVNNRGVLVTQRNEALPGGAGLFSLTWADLGVRGLDTVIARQNGSLSPGQGADSETAASGAAPGLTVDIVTTDSAAGHPITENLEQFAFFGARPLEFDASFQLFDTTPLVFSDSGYYGEFDFEAYLETGQFSYDIGRDTGPGRLALAVAVENPTSSTRLVLIGDRDFATNGFGLQTSPPNSASFVYPDNARFLLNAVGWLLGVEGNVAGDLTFPTPGPTATATITPSPTPSPTPTPEATESTGSS